MAGNVLLGGIIGAGVDVATGAMNKFVPNPLNVELEPTEAKEKAKIDEADADLEVNLWFEEMPIYPLDSEMHS